MSNKCTLSDKELIEQCNAWVHSLAKSGGKTWTLQVPVNFNLDPDMLFIELGKRFEQLKAENSKMRKALEESVSVIRHWHGESAFDIYYECSPEMKLIRESLKAK